MGSNDPTISLLRAQWTNPSDVLSVLLIIGGDLVQKALAQTSGGPVTPVCLSFGWVAYSLTALVGVVGDGRLLPPPDYPAMVFNLKNGYKRDNRNWVVGRIVRDNEIFMSKKCPLDGKGIRIAVYEACPSRSASTNPGSGRVRSIAGIVMLLQFGIAAIPWIIDREWGVLMITLIGTALAVAAGALPQWKVEKLPARKTSRKNFALTSGNGSRDIMIVLGCGNSLDLEELAAAETPRSTRLWETVTYLSAPIFESNGRARTHPKSEEPMRRSKVFRGIPIGHWITLLICVLQCFWWLALLITVAGLRSHAWYLLLVGVLGMFQNATIAGISRSPSKRGLPLKRIDTIDTRSVMDGLMDYEFIYKDYGGEKDSASARHLLREFFPGDLHPEEKAWWNGNTSEYDDIRVKEARSYRAREPPRTRIGRLNTSTTTSLKEKSIMRNPFPAYHPPPSSSYGSTVDYNYSSGLVPVQPLPKQETYSTQPSSPASHSPHPRPFSVPEVPSGFNSGNKSARNSYGSGSTGQFQRSSKALYSASHMMSTGGGRESGPPVTNFGHTTSEPQRHDTESSAVALGANDFSITPSPDWV
jgi:hypothetical protein